MRNSFPGGVDGLPIRSDGLRNAQLGLRLIESRIRANKLRKIGSVLGRHILHGKGMNENRRRLSPNRLIVYWVIGAEERVDEIAVRTNSLTFRCHPVLVRHGN